MCPSICFHHDDLPLLRSFVEEAAARITRAQDDLRELESRMEGRDAVENLFRALHSIKAVAGFLRLEPIQTLADGGENLLERARGQAHRLASGEFAWLREAIQAIGFLVAELDSLTSAQAQSHLTPTGQLRRMLEKLIAEASQLAGKQVELVFHPGEVELTCDQADALRDPLVHLARNGVDHGIEPPEDRIRAGKPRSGRIAVALSLAEGTLTVEVADDGRGLDREAIVHRAIAAGVIVPQAVLSAAQIDELIFLPGLSTRARAGDLSGRGVGMDAVKHTIDRLGGQVRIDSQPGRGTIFTICLPIAGHAKVHNTL